MHTLPTGTDVRRPTVPWSRQALTFTRLTLRSQLESRRTLLFVIGFPLVLYLLESRMFLPTTGPEVAVGRSLMAASFAIFGAFSAALIGFAGQLSDDVTTKRYRKLRSLPVAPSADFAGRFLGGYVVAAVAEAVVFGLAYLDGGSFRAFGPASVVVILASLFAFCVVSMAVATVIAIVLRGDNVPQVASFLLIIVFFVTGFNGMSPSALPAAFQPLVNLAPNSLAARLQMAALVGQTDVTGLAFPTGAAYAALVGLYAVVGIGAGAVLFRQFIYAGEVGE